MKKKVKIIIIIVTVVILASILIQTAISGVSYYTDDSNMYAKHLMNNVDFALFLYGRDILFPSEMSYDKLESIDIEAIDMDHDYVYLIINDLFGNVQFTEDRLCELLSYADEHLNFSFIYIGTEKLPLIAENVEDFTPGEEDASFAYVVDEGYRMINLGIWRVEDYSYLNTNEKMLGETLCFLIDRIVKTNE